MALADQIVKTLQEAEAAGNSEGTKRRILGIEARIDLLERSRARDARFASALVVAAYVLIFLVTIVALGVAGYLLALADPGCVTDARTQLATCTKAASDATQIDACTQQYTTVHALCEGEP